jgi:predicted dehydrogenase
LPFGPEETTSSPSSGRHEAPVLLAIEENWFVRSVRRSIEHVLAAIAGDEIPIVPVSEALMSMRTLEAADRSVLERRTVEVL